MIQADSVHNTPPTNTPIDTTRRRFLSTAAGGAVAAAIPAAGLPAMPAVDPIYAAIEKHRKVVSAVIPTSLPGLLAMLSYVSGAMNAKERIASFDESNFGELLTSIGTAAQELIQVQA